MSLREKLIKGTLSKSKKDSYSRSLMSASQLIKKSVFNDDIIRIPVFYSLVPESIFKLSLPITNNYNYESFLPIEIVAIQKRVCAFSNITEIPIYYLYVRCSSTRFDPMGYDPAISIVPKEKFSLFVENVKKNQRDCFIFNPDYATAILQDIYFF